MVTIELNEFNKKGMIFKAGDLFKQELPIRSVHLMKVSKQSTSKLNRYTVASATLSHDSNISKFGEEFVDQDVKVFFPTEEIVELDNEASTSRAFDFNVLLPLQKLFDNCFRINSQYSLGKFKVDHMMCNHREVPFLAVQVEPWNAFMNFEKDEASKEQILARIKLGVEFPRKEEFPAWYQHSTPNKKQAYENPGDFNLRMGMKQLHCYLNAMGHKPTFGILTTYCHTYFAILEDDRLQISNCVLYSDKNVLRYIASFIQLAINKTTESTPTSIFVTASPTEDVDKQDGRKRRNNEGRQKDTNKRKKGMGSGKDNSQCRQEFSCGKYVLGGIIGRGRNGAVLRLVDHASGQSFVAKGVDENLDKDDSEEDIIHDLHNEAAIYNKLKSLQGKVVPWFYGSVYLYNSMYTLIMEELDADPICPHKLSDDEKKAVVVALDKIHSQGVLHCDIREENILIDRRNKCPYIVDFGMSIECMSKKAFKEEKNELRSLLNLKLL